MERGQGKRCIGKHTSVKVPKDRRYIVIIEANLTEVGAFAIERRLIKWWGKKTYNTGILQNLCDGGEGNVRSKPLIQKKCLWCDREFKTKNDGIRYCSQVCGARHIGSMRRFPDRYSTCPTCNTSFLNNKNRTFCSYSCSNKTRDFEKLKVPKSTVVYRFKQLSTQLEHHLIVSDFIKLSGLSPQEANHLTSMNVKTYGDWTIWDESIQMFRNEIPKPPPYVRKKYQCCHCQGMFDVTNLGRWHNDNCKLKDSAPL